MPRRFVVYTTPRSGSRWLVELLNAHPDAVVYGEAFLAGAAGDTKGGDGAFPYFATYLARQPSWSRRALPVQRARYLEALYASGGDARAVGYKLMTGQDAQNPGALAWLAVRRVRVLHLVRRNTLRALVSHLVARERGQYHPRQGEELAPVRVSADVAALPAQIAQREATVAAARVRLARLRLPTLEVAYEDLVSDTRAELARVWPALGLAEPRGALETTLVQAVPSLGDVLANVEEVRAALAQTPYAWMLANES